MKEWFCDICGKVILCSIKQKCCNKELKEFNIFDAKNVLISNSNSFIDIYESYNEKWKHHSLALQESQKLYDDGCYGFSNHLITFIDKLIIEYEKGKR